MLLSLALPPCAAGAADWPHLRQGPYSVYYEAGEERFARYLLERVPPFSDSVAGDLGLQSVGPLSIYVCRDQAALLQALPPGYSVPGPWAAAAALPGHRRILLKSPAWTKARPGELLTSLKHELAHLALRQATGYRPVPAWFNEGLAMVLSGDYDLLTHWDLAQAVYSDKLVPLEELGPAFPQGEWEARAAYAQSRSAVAYLVGEYGEDGVRRLLAATRTGQAFPDAFQSALGVPLSIFEIRWQERVHLRYREIPAFVSGFGFWMLLAAAAVVTWIVQRRRNRRLLKEWETRETDEGPWLP